MEKHDWKEIEKDNLTIGLDVLYANKEKLCPTYVSKHNSNWEKQLILSANSKWSVLSREITSKHNNGLYALSSLHSFATENQREPHQTYLKIKIFVAL